MGYSFCCNLYLRTIGRWPPVWGFLISHFWMGTCFNKLLFLVPNIKLPFIFWISCKVWSVERWHWTHGHIHNLLTSTQKVDNVIISEDRHVAFGYTLRVGVIKTTWNIGTLPSSSISRELWDKPIMFIGKSSRASFTI